MSHTEVCPVCGGTGKYTDTYEVSTESEEGTGIPQYRTRICHGCGGKGWVTIEDNPVYTHIIKFKAD